MNWCEILATEQRKGSIWRLDHTDWKLEGRGAPRVIKITTPSQTELNRVKVMTNWVSHSVASSSKSAYGDKHHKLTPAAAAVAAPAATDARDPNHICDNTYFVYMDIICKYICVHIHTWYYKYVHTHLYVYL